MPELIPQSVSKLVVFRAFLSSDGKTPATGKTIAITISKNGGAFGNPNAGATNATEISSGFYKFTLDTTDTGTQGPLAYLGSESAIDSVGDVFTVSDAHNAGFDGVPSVTAGANGGLPTGNASGQVTVGGYASGQVPLQPTVAGRTLDVSAGGEAGVDWANVGSPTTSLNLSGTTVKTATDVEADTQDLQSRLPATLVSGRIDSSVGAYQTGLTPLQPTVAGRTLDVTAGGEAGIDWANIGSPTTVVGLSGTTVKTATDVEADTQDLQSRLPAALVSGRIDASVGAMASGVLTASAIAADAITDAKVASDVTIASVTGSVGSVTGAVGSVTAAVTVGTNNDKTGYALTAGERTSIANEVEAQIIDDTDSEKVLTAITDKIASVNPSLDDLTLAGIASAVRTELTTELGRIDATISSRATPAQVNTEADTALADVGLTTTITGRIDATISSRLATSGYTAPLDAAGTRTAVGLASANLDTQLGLKATQASVDTVDSIVDAIKLVTDKLDDTVEDDGGTFRFTANALEEAPTGGSAPTVVEIRNEMDANSTKLANLDDTITSRVSQSSFNISIAALGADIDVVDANVDDIKLVTDKLNDTLEDDGGTYRFTANALEESPASSLTVEEIRQEMDDNSTKLANLDDTITSRVSQSSFNLTMNAIGLTLDDMPDDVKAKIEEMFLSDTNAEPTAVPASDAPLADKIAWIYMRARNKQTLDSSGIKTIYADDGSTAVGVGGDSDDGTTFTSGQVA